MRNYIVVWSFIDENGKRVQAGDEVKYEERYGNHLKEKGLIVDLIKKQQAPESKAADTSAIETKPAPRRGRPPKTEGGKS